MSFLEAFKMSSVEETERTMPDRTHNHQRKGRRFAVGWHFLSSEQFALAMTMVVVKETAVYVFRYR